MNDQSSDVIKDSPWQTARDLYAGTLGGRSKGAIARSQVKFGGLKPHQRECITANLLYLEIQASEQVHTLLESVSRDLRNLTGAVYAIAKVVTQAREQASPLEDEVLSPPAPEADVPDVAEESESTEEQDLLEDGVDLEEVLAPVLDSPDLEPTNDAPAASEDTEGEHDGMA